MAKQQQQYRTYEDLMDEPRHESGGKIDFDVGEMFKLPAGIEWWMAKREWGKFKGEPKNMKPGDNERQVDVRFLGFLMDEPAFWPKKMADRVGGLVADFPLLTHRDPDGPRHLCLDEINAGPCPRCDKFYELREQNAEWGDMKGYTQRYSRIMVGHVEGDTSVVRAFEFIDTRPGAKFKDPTIFDRLRVACRGLGSNGKSLPGGKKIDPLFYSYSDRAQVLRLCYMWTEKQAGKGYWNLYDIYAVKEEDGAPSSDADPEIAKIIRPWEWLNVDGERERMAAGCGRARVTKPDFDSMGYGELMQYAIDNKMKEVLNEGFGDDEVVALCHAVKEGAK